MHKKCVRNKKAIARTKHSLSDLGASGVRRVKRLVSKIRYWNKTNGEKNKKQKKQMQLSHHKFMHH